VLIATNDDSALEGDFKVIIDIVKLIGIGIVSDNKEGLIVADSNLLL
jgi:hypothetical protein